MARLPAEVAAARIASARAFFTANPDATVEAFQTEIKAATGMRMSPNLAFKIRNEVCGNRPVRVSEITTLRARVVELEGEVESLKVQLATAAAPVPVVTGKTQFERVLAALRLGAATLVELSARTGDSAAAISARIRDARKAGYNVASEHVVGGDRYTLVEVVAAPVAA